MCRPKSEEYEVSVLENPNRCDLQRIARLYLLAWGEGVDENSIMDKASALRKEIEKMRAEDRVMMVAKRGREIIGCARLQRNRENPSEWCWFGLAVHPRHQRRGVAQALFEKSIAFARCCGGSELVSDVHVENVASIRLHENLGFHNCGPFISEHDGDKRVAFRFSIKEGKDGIKTR
jgi:L-amino acid N-acyltransferase YncA